MELIDINSLVLGILAVCLFAECIVLVVRVNSLRNKMEADISAARADERVKFEKKRSELELSLKERELELKGEYEDLLGSARAAKREQEEKLAETKTELLNAAKESARAVSERERYERGRGRYFSLAADYAEKLAKIAGVDKMIVIEDARAEIRAACARELENYRGEILGRSMRDVDNQARRILLDTMQRMSPAMPNSATCAIVELPDDAMKGRLIGKDGRNIRTFEARTATTLVIDDTPNSVMVSSFNPVRRAIAKAALMELVCDGRINPSSIEAAVAAVGKKIEQDAYDNGSAVAERLGLARVSPEITRLLGALGLHLSLNQDTLEHSVETAKLASMIASEIGCDAAVARRAGLFHDIGKAVENPELSHARAGAEVLRRAGESEIVTNAVEAHHSEVADTSVYAAIVRTADSLSASRTGARMEAMDGFIKRIKTLENIALSCEGVAEAYVLQAGRELRAIVSPDEVDDARACVLVSDICEKIGASTNNSIPVKVTIIRESRWTKMTRSQ